MNAGRREIWIISVFLIVIVLVFGAMFWRVFYLKYYQRETFQEKSQRQLSAFGVEKPRRGQILDCRGRVLAASVKTYNAFVEPRVLKDYPDQVQDIAGQLQEIWRFRDRKYAALSTRAETPAM